MAVILTRAMIMMMMLQACILLQNTTTDTFTTFSGWTARRMKALQGLVLSKAWYVSTELSPAFDCRGSLHLEYRCIKELSLTNTIITSLDLCASRAGWKNWKLTCSASRGKTYCGGEN